MYSQGLAQYKCVLPVGSGKSVFEEPVGKMESSSECSPFQYLNNLHVLHFAELTLSEV